MSEPNSGILDYLTFVRTTLNRIRESDTGFVDSATMRLASQQMQHLCADLPEILSHFSPEDFLGQWPPEFQRYDKRSFEIWLDSLQRKLELRLGLHSEGHATISEAVLLVHGIRDFAEWQSIVSNALADLPRITIIPLKYGRFDALRFWCPLWTRRRPIKKLLWRMRDARTRSPTSKLSVIAHSFGTYAIGNILNENPDIRLHRLILCGGILPSDFRWDKISERVETEIINDCGIKDIWPVMAESTTFGYGPSGRFGFGTPGVRDRFHDFGHGGFFNEKFVRDFWLPWFEAGRFVNSPAPPRSGTRWHLLTIIQIKWCVILLVVFGIFWFAASRAPKASNSTLPKTSQEITTPTPRNALLEYRNRSSSLQGPLDGGWPLSDNQIDSGNQALHHNCSETIRRHAFWNFLAFLLKTELERRMKFANLEADWA